MKITPTNTIPESLGPAWGRSEGNPWNLCFSMRVLHCCHCRQMVTLLWVRVYMGLRVWRGLREFSNSFPCSLFGPCNVYWGRQSETKHCPVTLENVEPWKHQSQKAILGRSPPTLAHVQPSSCLGWQQDLAINGRFCAYSPNPSLTPAQQFSCSKFPQNVGIKTHQWPGARGSQVKGFVTEGLQSLWGVFPVWRGEMRGFPAEPPALEALMVQEWKLMVVQRHKKLIQTLVWWTIIFQPIV